MKENRWCPFVNIFTRVLGSNLRSESTVILCVCCDGCYYRFLEQFGRHNYVTPTSYLELISSFKTLLTNKRDEVINQF